MKKKWNLIHASRGFFSLLMILFTAHQLGIRYWKVGLFDWDSTVRSGAMDYFMLVSGFVLFHTYNSRFGDTQVAINYMKKRLLRIFPTYWYTLIPMIVFAPFFIGVEPSLKKIVYAFLLLPEEQTVAPHTMVLSGFLIFYILFGIAIYVGKGRGTVLLSLWFMGVFIQFTNEIWSGNIWLEMLFSKYHIYFLAGGFIANLVTKVDIPYPQLLVTGGFAGLVGAWLNGESHWIPLDDLYAYGIPSATILLGLALLEQKREWWIPRWLHFLGSASYTLFLTHFPIIVLLQYFFYVMGLYGLMGPKVAVIVLSLLTVLVGSLLYLVVERPLMSFLRWNKKSTVAART
ncbi:Peptidoglycan/LPS O-acetylase OafA/YrhL, contains acyltransferase and SGNH-hydrolase domains [Marininema mesophilum]|uniref:Peptidoglycan/LPS O-acetylase OafA/YrhL, contains acyltransferase and SGNH-hydrolase domains n=1 Tax=Marininema mesophilum TaxID=1048340 RepID=A0A1H2WDF8_9BACL|nr:acyltransferase [Marininema mesophilum]SDW78575.1 Peptidoglycan/LPS O-acetylase OafA/YrhL, contains acyltransferase and SGNH-hydrolase domains [Marininema mesophilum]